MPERGSFDVTAVAFHQTIERGIGRDNVLRLWRLFFFAALAGPPITPAATADAANVRALRRVTPSRWAVWQISHILPSQAGFLPRTILVAAEYEVNLEGSAVEICREIRIAPDRAFGIGGTITYPADPRWRIALPHRRHETTPSPY